jgi:hypothetical protein
MHHQVEYNGASHRSLVSDNNSQPYFKRRWQLNHPRVLSTIYLFEITLRSNLQEFRRPCRGHLAAGQGVGGGRLVSAIRGTGKGRRLGALVQARPASRPRRGVWARHAACGRPRARLPP